MTQLAHVWFIPLLFQVSLVDEVGQRSSAGKNSPVVRVALVHVAVKLLVVEALLLAHLAGEVMGSSKGRVQLEQGKGEGHCEGQRDQGQYKGRGQHKGKEHAKGQGQLNVNMGKFKVNTRVRNM
jgi:hypothetical protein